MSGEERIMDKGELLRVMSFDSSCDNTEGDFEVSVKFAVDGNAKFTRLIVPSSIAKNFWLRKISSKSNEIVVDKNCDFFNEYAKKEDVCEVFGSGVHVEKEDIIVLHLSNVGETKRFHAAMIGFCSIDYRTNRYVTSDGEKDK